MDSEEIPILDGAARAYDNIIKSVGTTEQLNKFKKYLFINKKIRVENKNSVFEIEPSNFLKLVVQLTFLNQ